MKTQYGSSKCQKCVVLKDWWNYAEKGSLGVQSFELGSSKMTTRGMKQDIWSWEICLAFFKKPIFQRSEFKQWNWWTEGKTRIL